MQRLTRQRNFPVCRIKRGNWSAIALYLVNQPCDTEGKSVYHCDGNWIKQQNCRLCCGIQIASQQNEDICIPVQLSRNLAHNVRH